MATFLLWPAAKATLRDRVHRVIHVHADWDVITAKKLNNRKGLRSNSYEGLLTNSSLLVG